MTLRRHDWRWLLGLPTLLVALVGGLYTAITYVVRQEALLESLVRGECIENPRQDLARQGLLQKCINLGITPHE